MWERATGRFESPAATIEMMLLNIYKGLKPVNHPLISKELSSRRKNPTTYK
jgi:hypothetical protein